MNYIADQIVKSIKEKIEKKHKKEKMNIKPHQIKQHLWLFINCLIENPAFDSQTKENMSLKSSKFGSTVELSDSFLKSILDSGIVELVMEVHKAKEKA